MQLVCFTLFAVADDPASNCNDRVGTEVGDRLVSEYFRTETDLLSQDVVTSKTTLAQWQEQRPERQRQLREMLGLDPMPPRGDLKSEVIDSVDHGDYRVERLHFQPIPGLYVAANYYLPSKVDRPLPTILYTCGHGATIQDGVSFGNKTAYHHHGVWFARNGYTCLIVDTIQLGEFLGDHHGTYRQDQWWWNNRGYSPAGVEAWTGVRALDYLETREEVDAERFGVTGRSGGGAYSWYITAIDDRVKVAVPVAGIATLNDHVVDGCVEGHCDCMFMVNTYRWDYSMVAALVAPRPLLISNTDKDRIFPLEGVLEVHRQVRDVYRLYNAADRLGLQITEGPHQDTQALRVHAFAWFNRFLKQDESLIAFPAEKKLEPNELKVFRGKLPTDEIVTTVQETFVAKSNAEDLPQNEQALADLSRSWQEALLAKTFAGWPDLDTVVPLNIQLLETVVPTASDALRCDAFEFTSQLPYRLPFYVIRSADPATKIKSIRLHVLEHTGWEKIEGELHGLLDSDDSQNALPTPILADWVAQEPGSAVVLFAPRGIGCTRWNHDGKTGIHIQRRFMLLGQTVDAMQIYDIRRCIAAIQSRPEFAGVPVNVTGRGRAAAWLLYANFEPAQINELRLRDLEVVNRNAISLLNVSRIVEMPQAVLMASRHVKQLRLDNDADLSAKWDAVKKRSPLFDRVK